MRPFEFGINFRYLAGLFRSVQDLSLHKIQRDYDPPPRSLYQSEGLDYDILAFEREICTLCYNGK